MRYKCTKNHQFKSDLDVEIALYSGFYDVHIIENIVKINGNGSSQAITKTELDNLVKSIILISA